MRRDGTGAGGLQEERGLEAAHLEVVVGGQDSPKTELPRDHDTRTVDERKALVEVLAQEPSRLRKVTLVRMHTDQRLAAANQIEQLPDQVGIPPGQAYRSLQSPNWSSRSWRLDSPVPGAPIE